MHLQPRSTCYERDSGKDDIQGAHGLRKKQASHATSCAVYIAQATGEPPRGPCPHGHGPGGPGYPGKAHRSRHLSPSECPPAAGADRIRFVRNCPEVRKCLLASFRNEKQESGTIWKRLSESGRGAGVGLSTILLCFNHHFGLRTNTRKHACITCPCGRRANEMQSLGAIFYQAVAARYRKATG